LIKLFFLSFIFILPLKAAEPLIIGSKNFTESVILGEILHFGLKKEKVPSQHKAEFGGTRILWNALLSGDIDVYPEYSGTIEQEILQKKFSSFEEMASALKEKGIGISGRLGFNNTYAMGMKRGKANELGIQKISDLQNHPKLRFGFSEEFRQRNDGWPGMKTLYRLPQLFVRGLDHDIAYRALDSGDIDLSDLYSTDSEIKLYDLLILKDDASYFPKYEAVYLYRLDLLEKSPALSQVLSELSGSISNEEMVRLNGLAKIEKKRPATIASGFINERFDANLSHKVASRSERIWVRTKEHLNLVLFSLTLAILFAIPLGILSSKYFLFGKIALTVVASIQTIPALALLVILIRPLNLIGLRGIGDTPALIALFLYSLLPIVRNTHGAIEQIPRGFKETASVLGLSTMTKLFRIELPLSLPGILTGIKTAAVLNVGFATLGALIGAGGYGQPILTGIRLDDYGLILEGAIPAMVLAFVAQGIFEILERVIVSPGLRK